MLPIIRNIQAAGHTSLNSIAGQLNGTEPPLAQWCVVQRGVPQPARPRAARYALRSLLVDELNELNELSPLSLSPLVRFFRLFRSPQSEFAQDVAVSRWSLETLDQRSRTQRRRRCGGSKKRVGMVDLIAEGKNVSTVLFLCIGNYYRLPKNCSIMRPGAPASIGQPSHAVSPWNAGRHNIRPIAPVVLHALKELTISARGADRLPQQCTVHDLADADFVVAVKEAEHLPLMRERFAEWEHRLDYWNVHDVEDAAPAEALKLLAREIRMLLQRFHALAKLR